MTGQPSGRGGTAKRRRAAALAGVVALIAPVGAALTTTSTASATSVSAAVDGGGETAAPPHRAADPVQGISPGTYRITLITGDEVSFTVDPDGRTRTDLVGGGTATGKTSPEGVFLVPEVAQPYLDADLLDPQLFNLTVLVKQGYTDRRSARIGLIVDYPDDRRRDATRPRSAALAASQAGPTLRSLNATPVEVRKAGAERFWRDLTRGVTAGGTPSSRSTSPSRLSGGIEKVWLDSRVRLQLDDSVDQIGAPEAWAAGYDGAGVTVAVLDTGIDQTHPDFDGRIVGTKNFTSDESVADVHGHGTHVASTIAGSGAASDGRYRGVSSGAQLAIGKVLDKTGRGTASGVISGMEWAARDMDADVVSLSLGAEPTDGVTDPMSMTVNMLSVLTDTLFVVAAGNEGPSEETVASPGAAVEALTVGAVDKQDQLADFSSRGPVVETARLKPEITAPGVSIVAARASGTSMGTPVDQHYTGASGTSMATPHVAGAAAILAQQHPDWGVEKLKTTLVSTAQDGGFSAWSQGAGRVDVARAVSQKLRVDMDYGEGINRKLITASISPGMRFPGDEPVSEELTIVNDSDQERTVSLAADLQDADGESAPDQMIGLDQSEVTVPAGSSATVTVTIEHGAGDYGDYNGRVTATTQAGDHLVVPVALANLPELNRLTVEVVKPIDSQQMAYFGITSWNVLRVDDRTLPWKARLHWRPTSDPNVLTATALVPDGAYAIGGGMNWIANTNAGRSTSAVRESAQVYEPEVTVDDDTEITMDMRTTVPLEVHADRPSDSVMQIVATTRTTESGILYGSWSGGPHPGARVWLYPTADEPSIGAFKLKTHHVLAQPQVTLRLSADGRSVTMNPLYISEAKGQPVYEDGVPAGHARIAKFARDQKLAVATLADVEAGRDVTGKLVYVDLREAAMDYDDNWGAAAGRLLRPVIEAGAAGILTTTDTFGRVPLAAYNIEELGLVIPLLWMDGEQLAQFGDLADDGGRLRARVDAVLETPYEYKLVFHELDGVPTDPTYTVNRGDLKRVDTTYHVEAPRDPNRDNSIEFLSSYRPEDTHSFAWPRRFDGPTNRTEYYNVTGEDVVWSPTFHWYDLRTEARRTGTADRTITDTRAEQEHWSVTPTPPGQQRLEFDGQPRAHAICAACRQGETFRFSPVRVEGEGTHQISGAGQHQVRLIQDGREVPASADGSFELAPGPGTYRLEHVLQDGFSGTDYAKTIRTDWTFTSDGAPVEDEVVHPYGCVYQIYGRDLRPCGYEPLIFLSYDIPLSAKNTARAGRPLRMTIHAASPRPGSAADITGLRLEASFDDGATWSRARWVRGVDDGVFRALIKHPRLHRTTGAVSLRTTAWDRDGNRVTQTVERAYGLTGR